MYDPDQDDVKHGKEIDNTTQDEQYVNKNHNNCTGKES